MTTVSRPAADAVARVAEALTPPPGPVTVPTPVAVRRGRGATAVMLGSLAGFGVLFWLVRTKRSEAFDLAMTLRFQRRHRPWLDRLMTVASWPGFPPQSRVIPPTIIGLLLLARLRTEAAFFVLAWASATVSTALKAISGRTRPTAGPDLRVVVAPLGGSSFPSGHVLTFVGTYGFSAYLAATLIRSDALRTVAAGSLLGLVVLVGPSRIYQGHHWATDVTASYLVGTAYLIAVVTVYRRVKEAEAAGRAQQIA
jgi:membrane-associated phospholipid phosphatase